MILSTESPYESLYRWFLREEHERSDNLIPWQWTLYFDLKDIRLTSSVKVGDRYAEGEGKSGITEKDSIVANLAPGRFRPITYSMLGTDRPLLDFLLRIETAQDDAKESCHAWGFVSYTSELDFRYETTPDVFNFTLYISKSRFARLAALIREKGIDMASLRVSQVDGFYSEWSPGISTDSIKVLPDGKDHPVEIPDGCTIQPPRLGAIGEFELFLNSMAKFSEPLESTIDVPDDEEEQSAEVFDPALETSLPSGTFIDDGPHEEAAEALHVPHESPMHVVAMGDPKILSLLKSLRSVAWVIAALLLCILVLKR